MANLLKEMDYHAFATKANETNAERAALNISIFDKALALEVGEILKKRLNETLDRANDVASYEKAKAEIASYQFYLNGIKEAFPEIQFISLGRRG